MSVFKDFPGLENLEKLFQDFQGPARALAERQRMTMHDNAEDRERTVEAVGSSWMMNKYQTHLTVTVPTYSSHIYRLTHINSARISTKSQ